MKHRRIALIAVLALGLAGCAQPQPAAQPTAAKSTTVAQSPTAAPSTPQTATQPPAPAPVAAPAQPAGLRSVHSPGVVTMDEALQSGQCHAQVLDGAAGYVLPDPACTPGAVDPAVTAATLATTICKTGYTTTVRPPSSQTSKFKATALAAYGIAADPSVELDHLIPLELGGANSASNLWPESNRAGATATTNPKDALENRLNKAVCSGAMTLETAWQVMLDWPHNL